MAKNKKPSVGDPGDDAPDPSKRSPIEQEQERQEQELVDLLRSEQLDGGFAIINRRAVNEVEFGYVGQIAAKTFSHENIKIVYGGGDYKVQFKSAAGKFVGRAEFKIDYRVPALYPGVTDKPKEAAQDRTPELVTAVTAAIKSSLPPPPPPPDNTLTLELIRSQGNMLQALLTRPAGPDPTVTALSDMMKEFRAELRSLREREAPKGDNFFNEIKKFQTLSEMFGNGGGGEAAPEKPDRVSQLIEHFGPVGAQLLMKMMNMQQGQELTPEQIALLQEHQQRQLTAGGAASSSAAAGAASSSATAAEPVKPATPADPTMNPLFELYLTRFRTIAIQAASRGRDAYEWAEDKMDEIEPQYHEAIYKLANVEDWFAKIFGKEPAAANHLAWLLAMRNGILTRFFVGEVAKGYKATPTPVPETFASELLDRMSVSFEDRLWDLLDPQAWTDLFAEEKIDAVWLEKLRVAFEKEIGGDQDDSPGVTSPATAEAGASQPPPKKPRGKKSVS